MELVLGLADLRSELAERPAIDQVLHVDLKGRDPDAGMTQIPYEKGALLMRTLEQTFGRPKFDLFLKAYFDRFAFQSITTADFEAFVRESLFKTDPTAANKVDLAAWIDKPGLPSGFPEPRSSRFDAIDELAGRWVKGGVAASDLNAKAWSTQEWLRFLRALPTPLLVERMAQLDGEYHLTEVGNSEIASLWLLMAIQNNYHPADSRLESFLTTIGRRKLIVPLYKALVSTPTGKARARTIYAKARPFYHPIAVDSVDRLLR
jgi:leukotriene-A4 hydrolase